LRRRVRPRWTLPRPAASSLETALVAFVQAHEVVMMHEAKPQVAAGKNAQIDVRVAKLREEWIANESIILNSISSHDMSSPAGCHDR
jgi:hypothetical protein